MPGLRTSLSWLPPLDVDASPVTGWTRTQWESLADHILDRAKADASPGQGRIRPATSLRGRSALSAVDQLEGFARTFLLASLRLAQPRSTVADEAQRERDAEWWATGLMHGTDPSHADAWPTIVDHDQTMVEAAAIAVGLHWSREIVWDRLDGRARERVIAWLSTSRGRTCAENNHVLFLASVQAFLASVGAEHDRDHIEAALATIEQWYVGDGWYTDGFGRRFDYYNAYTFHLYPWLIDDMLGTTGVRLQRWRDRLGAFLSGYGALLQHGVPVLQGRSLAYRWAVLGPIWLGAALGVSPWTPGQTRQIASRMVSGFVNQGVAADGRLTLGWRGKECEGLLQTYSMAGSPHWASKGMLGLLLPVDHPVWVDPEVELCAYAEVSSLAGPGWLVDGTRGITRLLNHGSDGHPRHDSAWYRRLAYSDSTVPATIDQVRDNSVVPIGGDPTWIDRGLRGGLTGPDWACSHRVGDLGGVEVHLNLVSLVRDGRELRVARIPGAGNASVRMSGYAVSTDDDVQGHSTDSAAQVKSGGIRSDIRSLPVAGQSAVVTGGTVRGSMDSALGSQVGIPYVDVVGEDGTEIVAALVSLERDSPEVGSTGPDPVITVAPGGIVVEWGDRVRTVPWPPAELWPGDALDQGIWTPWPAHGSALDG